MEGPMEESTDTQRLSKTLARLKKIAEVYASEYNMEKRNGLYDLVEELAKKLGIS